MTWPNAIEQLRDDALESLPGTPTEAFVLFLHVPGLNDGYYRVYRYALRASFNYAHDYFPTPSTWYRISETQGWDAFGTNETMNWQQEPPSVARRETTQPGHSTWITYVYDVYAWPSNIHMGWFPRSPAEASVAITAIGRDSAVGVPDYGLSVSAPRIMAVSNPASGAAWFRLELSQAGSAKIRLYDIAGRLVRTLVDAPLSPGSHDVQWDGRNGQGDVIAGGVYFYQLDVDGERVAHSKLIVKR